MPGQFNEQGRSGLDRSNSGQVSEEFLPQLQGRNLIRTVREMSDNDPVVGAVLFVIDMLCRQVDWRAEASDDETAEEDVEFLDQCKDDMSHTWSDFVSEILSMLVYGWSFFEIVYKPRAGKQEEGARQSSSKYDDGKIGWRKIALRSQDSFDRWSFDDAGGLQAMVQKPPPDYADIVIPMQKALLFRTSTYKDNPEGRTILRNAYRPWFFKKRIEMIEAVGIERDLAGLPVAEVDPAILRADASDEEKALLNVIERIVRNIKRDKEEGIVWPRSYDENNNPMYELKLLSSGGSRSFDTSAIIQRKNQEIAMTVLADFILLGHEKVGSFALSDDKTDLFAVALGAWLDVIEDVINRFAVPRLLALNGMDLEHPPILKHGDIEKPDLAKLGAYIQMLTGAGVPLFPDDDLEAWLREIGSLPKKSKEALERQEEEGEETPTSPEGGDDGTDGNEAEGGEPD